MNNKSSQPKYPSELSDKFMLRLPDGMRDRIREAAEKNNRSMNSEIVSRLEDSFELTAVGIADHIKPINKEQFIENMLANMHLLNKQVRVLTDKITEGNKVEIDDEDFEL